MKVEIISDLTCPWAYIGWHRLQQAMAQFRVAHPEAELNLFWRPYYIQDKATPVTTKIEATRAAKGKAMTAQYMPYVAKKLANEGLRFSSKGPIGPTQKAHLLVKYIADRDPSRLSKVVYDLYDAFFWQCRNIFEIESLLELSKEIGIEDSALKEYLTSHAEQDMIDREADKSAAHHGVPWFLIGHDELEGVQEVATLYETLERNYSQSPSKQDDI